MDTVCKSVPSLNGMYGNKMWPTNGLELVLRKKPLVCELWVTELLRWAVKSHVWLPLGVGHRLPVQDNLGTAMLKIGEWTEWTTLLDSFCCRNLMWTGSCASITALFLSGLLFLFPTVLLWDWFELHTWSGKCQNMSYAKAPCSVVSIYTSQKLDAWVMILNASKQAPDLNVL